MIKVYLLTEEIDIEAEKIAELTGKEYEPNRSYIESYVNLRFVMRIIPQDKEDMYLISFPDEDVTAKINKDEMLKISKG